MDCLEFILGDISMDDGCWPCYCHVPCLEQHCRRWSKQITWKSLLTHCGQKAFTCPHFGLGYSKEVIWLASSSCGPSLQRAHKPLTALVALQRRSWAFRKKSPAGACSTSFRGSFKDLPVTGEKISDALYWFIFSIWPIRCLDGALLSITLTSRMFLRNLNTMPYQRLYPRPHSREIVCDLRYLILNKTSRADLTTFPTIHP